MGRTPHWHSATCMKKHVLQQDITKNDAKSGPLSPFRASACSGEAKRHQQTEEGGGCRKQACRVWLSRTPHWHSARSMEKEELQQDIAKNEAKSGPPSPIRAPTCSGKARGHQQLTRRGGEVSDKALLNRSCVIPLLLGPWHLPIASQAASKPKEIHVCRSGGCPLISSDTEPPPLKKLGLSRGWPPQARLSQTSATCCGTVTSTSLQEKGGKVCDKAFSLHLSPQPLDFGLYLTSTVTSYTLTSNLQPLPLAFTSTSSLKPLPLVLSL
jgi:hypothetical protein